MTVRTRITLFIAGAGFISSLLFSIIVFYELVEQPFDLLDRVLQEEAHLVTRMNVTKQGELASRFPDAIYQTADRYWIEIYEQDTHKMLFQSSQAKSVKLPPVRPGFSAIARASVPQRLIRTDQNGDRGATFRIKTFLIELDGRLFVVQIAKSIEHLEEEIWELVFGIAAGLIFSTLVLCAISRFMAGKILQPIGRMNDLVQDISEKNLDQRVPAGEGRDEFNELARTINRMLDRLQYSFTRQRNFLFDTSHELKTPLTTMRLAVDQIDTASRENLPSLVRDNLLRLNTQVLRMDRLVKDLLSLSALETLTSIDATPVQITELLSSLAGEYQFLTEARNITMDIHLPEGLVIHGDGEKLRRAFSNLLDNAVKYNIDGGRIELTGDSTADKLTVTIFNTGPGVAEAEIPRVFDQFFRVEKSRSLQHGGSGLGLAIVKRIIELHGGKIKFESRQGAWTRVTVSLPV
ncbi:MAG: ATP-binding protein [Salinivirgaceae bacterium]|nr:ATP-binding protein [Salinivirgaceae bacterium]